MDFNEKDNSNLYERYNPLRDESSFSGESSEIVQLKAEADMDLDAMNGFVQGGSDDFSQNNIDQDNNTITYSLYNPTTAPLKVELYGFDPANFTTVPVNTPPIIQSGLIPVPPLGSQPVAQKGSICTANNTLYIGDKTNDLVTVWNCNVSPPTLITTIVFPIGFTVLAPCYCPLNNQMYVASGGFPQVLRIDCNTNTIIGAPIVTTSSFSGETGALVYNSVKNSMYGKVVVINIDVVEISCISNLQVAYIPSGILFLAYSSFNPLNNRLYIADLTAPSLAVFDCITNTFLAPIPVPFALGNRFSNCYCSFNNSIYQVSTFGDIFVKIDTATLVVSGPFPTLVNGQTSIIYNPINNLIYISGQTLNDYTTLDVATNILTGPIAFAGAGIPLMVYNQSVNVFYTIYPGGSVFLEVTPLFAPTVTITMPGGVTPAMIYNDTQTKPFLIRGVRIITDNFSQWNNNITFSNTSYTGALDSKQWQPLNYISPTNANTFIVDAPDFVLDVDRGPDSTALDFVIQPLTNVILLFTVGKSLDSSTIFSQQNKEDVDNTTAIRYTGNPIADIFLSKMTKEEIAAQESKYSSTEYANYPRETGNPIADIALLRNYGIQGI